MFKDDRSFIWMSFFFQKTLMYLYNTALNCFFVDLLLNSIKMHMRKIMTGYVAKEIYEGQQHRTLQSSQERMTRN